MARYQVEDRHARSSSRSRSRSPHRSRRSPARRERSPVRKHSRRHHHAHHRSKRPKPEPAVLPFKAAKLSRHSLASYRPLLVSYLDIQKQIDVDELDEVEVKGRWKSFMGKWNRGELAEGWYDPETIRKTLASAAATQASTKSQSALTEQESGQADDDDSSEADEYGPRPPRPSHRGPAVPGFADLELRDELTKDTTHAARLATRAAHKEDKRAQRAQLDELALRAEPGTRERQLEKRREAAASNRAFADARDEAVGEVRDADLLGGGDGGGGMDDFRARRREFERKKNEREIRREEILRARAAEREVRLGGLRAKEEETVELLRAIAKERFGSGGGGGAVG